MKKILFLAGFLSTSLLMAQATRVVMHLQTADTLVYKSIANQVSNIKKALPDAHVELVCHGPGIDFLKKGSVWAQKIQRMQLSDVAFAGCEFTMRQRGIDKMDLVPFATIVPYGLVEIIEKQKQGWVYIKLGF